MSLPPRIVVALDFDDVDRCLSLVNQLEPQQVRLKVGKELFATGGPQIVEQLVQREFSVFLDLKYHDIPNTVAKAITAASKLGVWMLNVHASGGLRMMTAAREAIEKSENKPLLIGVTVLTSMTAEDLAESGVDVDPETQVLRLAKLTKEAGLDGVVCSAKEVKVLRQEIGKDFVLVTPGIRPAGSDQGDQRRVVTPKEALELGSDYLVIGRPITAAEDPKAACEQIIASL